MIGWSLGCLVRLSRLVGWSVGLRLIQSSSLWFQFTFGSWRQNDALPAGFPLLTVLVRRPKKVVIPPPVWRSSDRPTPPGVIKSIPGRLNLSISFDKPGLASKRSQLCHFYNLSSRFIRNPQFIQKITRGSYVPRSWVFWRIKHKEVKNIVEI